MTKEQAIKHLKLMQSGARNAIRYTKNDKKISEEERKEDIEIYQDQLEALEMAIKALEQQPIEDCVSRQAVLDKAWDVPYDGKYIQVVDVGDIQELPPVTPTQRWIPVSEELPKKNMPCLISVGDLNLTQIAMYSDLMGTIDHKIFYQGDYGHDSFMDITKYVKAWMPLLEPYEEKRGSEDGSN